VVDSGVVRSGRDRTDENMMEERAGCHA
jgi:hypothetical protein